MQSVDEYYRFRGWSDQGKPLPKKLEELGLKEYIYSF
jgi:aldehyde:ferredoxin oxidoreductase